MCYSMLYVVLFCVASCKLQKKRAKTANGEARDRHDKLPGGS